MLTVLSSLRGSLITGTGAANLHRTLGRAEEDFSLLFVAAGCALHVSNIQSPHQLHSIERTPAEMERAARQNAPWREGKHWRFDAEFRMLLVALISTFEASRLPDPAAGDGLLQQLSWDELRQIAVAWSVVWRRV